MFLDIWKTMGFTFATKPSSPSASHGGRGDNSTLIRFGGVAKRWPKIISHETFGDHKKQYEGKETTQRSTTDPPTLACSSSICLCLFLISLSCHCWRTQLGSCCQFRPLGFGPSGPAAALYHRALPTLQLIPYLSASGWACPKLGDILSKSNMAWSQIHNIYIYIYSHNQSCTQ